MDHHHEVRRALGRFLSAKRDLGRAYRNTGASHLPAGSNPMHGWDDINQAKVEPVTCEELWELKDENERLRKSLALLHVYSLRIQDQLDILAVQRDRLLDTCEGIASWMRYDHAKEEHPIHLLRQLDDVISEITNNRCA
jgi:hypothetical protein